MAKKHDNTHDKMRKAGETGQQASAAKSKAGEKLENNITDIGAAIEWFQAHTVQENSHYEQSVHFRHIIIQEASYDIAAATVKFEDKTQEWDKYYYNRDLSSALNRINIALNITFDNDDKETQDNLVPLLYKDAAACREDTIAFYENRKEIINSPQFQATKGRNFLNFYQNMSDAVSDANRQSVENIFHNHILPYING